MLAITVKNHQNKKIVVWGIGEFQNYRDDVTYMMCKNEKDLLQEFLVFWEKHQPDVITGWNSEFFDIPYILTEGGPGTATMPYGMLIHRTYFKYFDVGKAAAISVVLLLIGIVVALIYVRISKIKQT